MIKRDIDPCFYKSRMGKFSHFPPLMSLLTVNNGFGTGYYPEGDLINVSANAPSISQAFDKWIASAIDIAGIGNVNDPATTYLMGKKNAIITATYKNKYWLTVDSGGGDGYYLPGVNATINADDLTPQKEFVQWVITIGSGVLGNASAQTTTYTMPSSDSTVTATYKNMYELTVNSGTGGGWYEAGDSAHVVADDLTPQKIFDKWIGDIYTGFADTSSDTYYTMPASTATLTATYNNLYKLSLVNATSPDLPKVYYLFDEYANIQAGAAPSGQTFTTWSGGTLGRYGDITNPTTTYQMLATDVTLTANYGTLYTLTVVNGTASPLGPYLPLTNVTIDADNPPTGQVFKTWVNGGSGTIGNAASDVTTYTMAASNATVTATYENEPPPPGAFIAKISIPSNNVTVSVPFTGNTVNSQTIEINWGDGTKETVTDVSILNPFHTYTTAGDYTVYVTGTIDNMFCAWTLSQPYNTKWSQTLTEIVQWGDLGLISMFDGCYGCTKLINIPKEFTCNSVIRMNNLFFGCTSLTYTFDNIHSTSLLYADHMFSMCTSLNYVSSTLFYDCKKIIDFEGVFLGCTALKTIDKDVFSQNKDVETFAGAFSETNLDEIPEDLFKYNTSVETFNATFEGANIKNATFPKLFATNTKARRFSSTFKNCEGLNGPLRIPNDLFFNINVTVNCYFNNTFEGSDISELPVGLFSKLTENLQFIETFKDCTSLTSISPGFFDQNTKLEQLLNTFEGCTSLTSIPLGLFDNNTAVEHFDSAFEGCTSLTGDTPRTGTIELWDRSTYGSPYPAGITGANCFTGCTGLTNYLSAVGAGWA